MNIEWLDDNTVKITETVAEINKRHTDAGMIAPIVIIPMPILDFETRAKVFALDNTSGRYVGYMTRMTLEEFKKKYPPNLSAI